MNLHRSDFIQIRLLVPLQHNTSLSAVLGETPKCASTGRLTSRHGKRNVFPERRFELPITLLLKHYLTNQLFPRLTRTFVYSSLRLLLFPNGILVLEIYRFHLRLPSVSCLGRNAYSISFSPFHSDDAFPLLTTGYPAS
jgi:hypothetical protein